MANHRTHKCISSVCVFQHVSIQKRWRRWDPELRSPRTTRPCCGASRRPFRGRRCRSGPRRAEPQRGRSAGAGHHGDSRDGRSLRQDESEEERGAAGRLPALPQRGRYSRYVFTYSCSPEVLPLCRHLCLKTCNYSYLCNYIYYI